MVVRGGFEPPKLARQIYSLIPLATREPHQKRAQIIALTHRPVNGFGSIFFGFFPMNGMNFNFLKSEKNS
jgi:hypothetical protein